MAASTAYDRRFFAGQRDASYSSASIVVPHVLALCAARSVVDFGSGVGTWLRAFQNAGVDDVIGIDGDYVNDQDLQISKQRFVRADLCSPINLAREFDLAVSLEVAEHLPSISAATFVDSLTRHSPLVLFSAAVPLQGGTRHINEQWPETWISLFGARGFVCVDCMRDVFWDDDRIAWWYRQNMFLFVKPAALQALPALRQELSRPRRFPLAVIHPGFIGKSAREFADTRWLLAKLPGALRHTCHEGMRKIRGRA
jgi:SAM-dependent methyltransferase